MIVLSYTHGLLACVLLAVAAPVFLSVFKWEARKGWKDLVRGFCEAFKPSDPVVLWILARPFLESGTVSDACTEAQDDVLTFMTAYAGSTSDNGMCWLQTESGGIRRSARYTWHWPIIPNSVHLEATQPHLALMRRHLP